MRMLAYLTALLIPLCAGCGEQGKSPAKKVERVILKPKAKSRGEEAGNQLGPWFVDEAQRLGVTMLNRTGRPGKKEFIMSAVGPGAAIFDANGDGRLDIYLPNGNQLLGPRREEFYTGEDRPRNALYIQQADGTFLDEARQRGVDHDGWGFGACAADLDNDGDQDLIVTNLSYNCLFINDGRGNFRNIAKIAGTAGSKVDWSTGIAIADYDKDGLLDVYVANYADLFQWMRESPDVERNEDGTIINAAVCIWQGLKVYCGPLGLPGQQDRLYRNLGGKNGELRFRDVTREAGIWRKGDARPLYGFQPLFTDLDHDGWLDIYIANDSVPSFLFVNRKGKGFQEVGQEFSVAVGDMGQDMAGMGADTADMNGDGWLDIHKTNFALQTNNLYIAEPFEGRVTFRDYSTLCAIKQEVYSDLGWAVLVFDYDNDGDRDIFYANGHVYPEVDTRLAQKLNMKFRQLNKMLRNDSRGEELEFTPVTDKLGPGFTIQDSSRGAALGDLDNDGDLDIVVVNLNGRPNVLVNRRGNKSGHWLQLRLVGNLEKKVPLEPMGTTLWVDAGGRRQFFELKRGQGFLGCHDPRLFVGLGSFEGAVGIEITWPSGEVQLERVTGLDRLVEIAQK